MSASSKKKLRKEQNAAVMTEKQLAEKKEAKKLKIYSVAFVAVIAVVLCIALVVGITTSYTTSGIAQRNTTALTVNDHKLSSVDLSYYYIDVINTTYSSWYESYGDYTDSFVQMVYGIDLTQPLSEQTYMQDESTTWADYFVDLAVQDAQSTYALYDAAVAEGRTLTEEELTSLDENISYLETMATLYGYTSFDQYLTAYYGYGASEESYRKYNEITYLASAYYSEYAATLSYDNADIEEYAAQYPNEYASFDFARYYIPYSSFLGEGTTDADGNVTYSDEEKATAIAAAKESAETVAKATTLDEMNDAIAALEINADTSAAATVSTNTLYANVPSTLQEWVAASTRKAGDIAVLANETTATDENGNSTTTTFGYYVVLFQGRNDNQTPLVNVRHILSSFEGGTTDENGNTTYSDEEKKAAYDELYEVYTTWKTGDATETSFADLAGIYSDDTGSITTGGLYEEVYPGQMVTAFNDWCFDESREIGDTEIIETEYGYHLMYYVSASDTTYRDYMITSDMTTADLNIWFTGITDAATSEVKNTSKLDRDITIVSAG